MVRMSHKPGFVDAKSLEVLDTKEMGREWPAACKQHPRVLRQLCQRTFLPVVSAPAFKGYRRLDGQGGGGGVFWREVMML